MFCLAITKLQKPRPLHIPCGHSSIFYQPRPPRSLTDIHPLLLTFVCLHQRRVSSSVLNDSVVSHERQCAFTCKPGGTSRVVPSGMAVHQGRAGIWPAVNANNGSGHAHADTFNNHGAQALHVRIHTQPKHCSFVDTRISCHLNETYMLMLNQV